MSDITRVFQTVDQGDPGAVGQLLPPVDDELRILAAHKLSARQKWNFARAWLKTTVGES